MIPLGTLNPKYALSAILVSQAKSHCQQPTYMSAESQPMLAEFTSFIHKVHYFSGKSLVTSLSIFLMTSPWW